MISALPIKNLASRRSWPTCLYFKYYFLDALRKPYDKQKLIDDFEALSNYLTHTEYKYFMFRDFQSRNIMVKSKIEQRSFYRLPGRHERRSAI